MTYYIIYCVPCFQQRLTFLNARSTVVVSFPLLLVVVVVVCLSVTRGWFVINSYQSSLFC